MTTKLDIAKLKPSELIRAALVDLQACVQDPRYVVNMEDWHEPGYGGPCQVCLAGAVMAKSLRADVSDTAGPYAFPELIRARLRALDSFREGCVLSGLKLCGCSAAESQAVQHRLKGDELTGLQGMEMGPDNLDLDAFNRAMTWLADQLEKEDL